MLIFLPVSEEIVYYFLVYFGIVQIWNICHSLDKRVLVIDYVFTSQRESHSVPDLDFFAIPSFIWPDLELSRIELPKLTPSILMEIEIISSVLIDQFYFYMHQSIRLYCLKSLSLS